MNRPLPVILAGGCLLLSGLFLGCQPAGNSAATTTGSGPASSGSGISGSGAPPPPPGATATGTAGSAVADEDAGAALVAAFRQAHQQQNVDGLLALYELKGASADMRETIRENMAASLPYPITNIALAPAPPGEHGPRTEGGIRWRPSLEVTALLTVDFDTSRAPPDAFAANQLVLTVGEKGGRCYLTAPVRE